MKEKFDWERLTREVRDDERAASERSRSLTQADIRKLVERQTQPAGGSAAPAPAASG